MNEKKIVSVIPVSGPGVITKGVTNSGRPGFSREVLYVFEDGTQHATRETTERKKNLDPHIERMDQAAKRGELAGSFNDDGKFWGTVQRFDIGARTEPIGATD